MNFRHYYIQRGGGRPLILLHGNGEEHGYFHHQIEYFQRYFRVIAPDTRGHGRSPRGTAPFTIRQFAEDLHNFFTEHEIKKAHILGFSDGGNIAMIFALRYPECVDRLILNGANLYSAGVRPAAQLPVIAGYYRARLLAKRSDAAKKQAELLRLMVRDPNLTPEDLAGISAKTLVIAGTKDMIKRSHTEKIARSIPGAQLKFLTGDHFIAERQPEAFNREIARFLLS